VTRRFENEVEKVLESVDKATTSAGPVFVSNIDQAVEELRDALKSYDLDTTNPVVLASVFAVSDLLHLYAARLAVPLVGFTFDAFSNGVRVCAALLSGESLASVCPACRAPITENASFCGACDYDLSRGVTRKDATE